MSSGASGGLTRHRRRGGDIGRGKPAGGGGVVFAFAEDAFEWGTGEPNKVTAGVHVQGDRLGRMGTEVEGEDIVTAGGERERNMAVAVAEAGGGASGGKFEKVVGTVELGFGERVS